MELQLTGKVALVTGGSRGIGAAIARRLARDGADVAITYVSSPDKAKALVRELQEHCKRVTAPYKYPREIEFLGELPKTISGKIRRVELRRRSVSPQVPDPP